MPRRFVWRRVVHDIARVEGPERIAPEWWRQPSSARLRDYYRVEDQTGRRYWIYREGLVGDGRGGLADLPSCHADHADEVRPDGFLGVDQYSRRRPGIGRSSTRNSTAR